MLQTHKPTEHSPSSSPGSLRQIPPLAVLHEWPRVAPLVRLALAHGEGSYLETDVANYCINGVWQLWVIGGEGEIKAIGISEVVTFPRQKKCLIRYLAGDLEAALPHWPAFESWAREQGCHVFEIYGRKGWVRKLHGWREVSAILQRTIS